jgi:hypothetical protein
MTDPAADASEALTAALERLLVPAHAAHPGLPEHRRASRVSATTGLHRREVQRLLDAGNASGSARSIASVRSPALEVFAHWLTSANYKTKGARDKAKPLALPRTGPEPSFQSLAQEVTRDIHPRALLEELLRLKLVRLIEAQDIVMPVPTLSHAPRGDPSAMLRYLGMNVGDHLHASVSNVLGSDPSYLEQSVSAEGLSEASLDLIRTLLKEQWQAVLQAVVPVVEQRVEADAGQADGQPSYRVRIGMYAYDTGPARSPGSDSKESKT